MRQYRFYHYGDLEINTKIQLDKTVSSHIHRVLRLKANDQIQLFNGNGIQYQAKITLSAKLVEVAIISAMPVDNESPLKIHLGQAISRGERMDFTLQKAVELGVHSIIPLMTERVQFRLDQKRISRKMNHWQKIIESACEQSGRTYVPELYEPIGLSKWLEKQTSTGIIFSPEAKTRLKDLKLASEFRLLIGPEGGLSVQEIKATIEQNPFIAVSLGPRILRTETAGLTAISILQSLFGDI